MLGPLQLKMNPLEKLARLLGATIATIALALSVLLANVFQTLSLVVRPFSMSAFSWINQKMAFLWWSFCVFILETAYGGRPVFTGDEIPSGENAFVFANHQQMPDILVLMSLAIRKDRIGDMKWFVKDPIKYVPGIGWGMTFLNCIFLKRDWMADQGKIRATFQRLIDSRMPFWMISFVEGTRIKPAKLAASQEYARKQGWPVPSNTLVPRTKGFVATLEGLGASLEAIYDVTIGYERGVPSMGQCLQGLIRRYHLHVRRYTLADLPKDEAGRARWLVERFREKDALLEEFYRTGRFPAR